MSQLQGFLNQLQARYHGTEYLASDPLEFVHRYTDPWDREAVALLAALLAYGNVKQIRRSVEEVLLRLHTVSAGPAVFVRKLDETGGDWPAGHRALKGWVHRFNRGRDLIVLFRLLGRSWREHGSLGSHFMKHLQPADPHFGPALDALIRDWRRWAGRPRHTSFAYLLTAPEDGSCCKRWCMFLRWMGRRDEIDPGLWTRGGALAATFPAGRFLRADQLVVPLDTHTGRISQYLELTRRKSVNWLAAVEVTESLKACDAEDPVRYDFAMARLGILDLCQKKFRVEICSSCELLPACKFARKHGVRK